MPELPEVETVRRGLNNLIVGKKVKTVDFDWSKSFPNAPADVEEFLIGAKITDVRRRAKVLIIDLDTDYSLVVHLKMTGQLVFVNKNPVDSSLEIVDGKAEKPTTYYQIPATKDEVRFGAGHPNDSLIGKLPDKSTRVMIGFENDMDRSKVFAPETSARKKRSAQQDVHEVRRASTGVSDKAEGQERWRSYGLCPEPDQRGATLYFNDQRKFGWMRLFPTVEVPNIDFMKKVGPEPLEDDFTPQVFIGRVRRRAGTTIKAAILDQTVLAGVGNIYADEALWGARIHPAQRVGDITDAKLRKLHQEIKYVLALSIEKGGSTDKNYVDAEGKRGSYLTFARVFRREGQPCPRHPGTVIIKTRVAGRGTHLCPRCQRLKLL